MAHQGRRGMPKRTWIEVVTIDLKKVQPIQGLAQDKSEWRNRIHVAHPNLVGIRL